VISLERVKHRWVRRWKVFFARLGHGLWKAIVGRFSKPAEFEIGAKVEVRGGGIGWPAVHEIAAPGAVAEDLAWDGFRLWVCDWDTSLLYQVDPVTGIVQWSVGTDVAMEAITWNGRAVCGASIAGVDAIYSIDPTDGTITRLCAAPGTDGGTRGLAWDGRHFWTNNLIDWTTYQIDAQGTVLRSFPTPFINPGGMTWVGGYLWTCELAGIFYRIDPLSGTVTDYILSPGNSPTGLTWDGGTLWNVDSGTHRIYQVRVA